MGHYYFYILIGLVNERTRIGMMDKQHVARFFSMAGLAAVLLLPLHLYADPVADSGLHGTTASTPTPNLKNDGEIGTNTPRRERLKGSCPSVKLIPPPRSIWKTFKIFRKSGCARC